MAKKTPIIKWTVDGVLARLTRRQSEDANLRAKMRPMVQATAVLAAHIKRRVQQRGDLGGQAWSGYSAGSWPVRISRGYAAAIGSSYNWFPSSVQFHREAGTLPGSFSVTGGLWSGLQVRGMGTSAAMIEFVKKSQGRGKRVVEGVAVRGRTTMRQRDKVRYVDERVDNRLKAFAVFDKAGVHLVMPTDAENVAIAAQVAYDVGRSLTRTFGASGVVVTGADLGLLAAFGR